MSKGTGHHIEHDSIGEKQIPKDTYYGVQTPHTAESFFIASLEMHPEFTNNFAQIKKMTAIADFEVGRLDKKHADTIVQVRDEVMSNKLHDELVVNPIQGGARTSLNMNVNETVANQAIGILGGEKGDYSVMDLNDHVDYGQSTNDVLPSRGKLTTLKLFYKAWAELERLCHTLMEESEGFSHVIKMGRTQFQDVVPIRLGQEFRAYATAAHRDINRFGEAKEEIRYLNLGGAAIGIGLNADVRYLQQVVKNISLISGLELIRAHNLVGATQSLDGYMACSGVAESCAVNLPRMYNNLGLISSGPRTGLGGVNLPAKRDDSSIMLEEIDPVILEVVSQIASYVIGNDMAVAMTAEVGRLKLSTLGPVIFYKLSQPVETIAYMVYMLVNNYIPGIMASEQHYKDMIEDSMEAIAAICPYMGYGKATNVAKKVIRTGKSIRELIIRDGLPTKE